MPLPNTDAIADGAHHASCAPKWKLIDGQALACRGWDGEYVLYNDVSGDTHLFGVDAIELLLQLGSGPADEDTLARVLQVAPDEREGMAVTLDELRALSLVERA